MIINPLKTSEKGTLILEEKNIYINKYNIVNKMIEYILDQKPNILTQNISKQNRKIVENIVKEKIIEEYSNADINILETVKLVLDRFFGYYILQEYIDNEEVSDIRVINYKTIYIKKKGKWELTNNRFADEKEYINFVRNCIMKNGGKINNEQPVTIVSDKENNLRIEAGIEPVNVVSPNLVIRIHRTNINENLEKLFLNEAFMFNSYIYNFLLCSILSGCNIVISGKGASGKTTLLRSLINKIPQDVSITSNEETAELFSNHPNIIQREIIQNRQQDKNITLEQLTKQCLVMSNDVIVVGELKGSEAMAFLDAIATGHVGYATIHSNSSKNTISRLSVLMKKDKNSIMYTSEYLEKLISNSIDIIIYMNDFKIVDITEVYYDEKKEKIIFNQLYCFKKVKFIDQNLIGYFKKVNNPKYKLKDKFKSGKEKMERIIMK